jgi:hypothetical protein
LMPFSHTGVSGMPQRRRYKLTTHLKKQRLTKPGDHVYGSQGLNESRRNVCNNQEITLKVPRVE